MPPRGEKILPESYSYAWNWKWNHEKGDRFLAPILKNGIIFLLRKTRTRKGT